MTARNLTRKLVLEKPVRVADGAGGYSETWTPLGTVWAEFRSRSGRERGIAGTAVSAMAYRVFVRAAPVGDSRRPVPGQRFIEGARVFAIEAVSDNDQRGRYLECFVQEEVAT